jgi:hypothetical protein
MEETPFRRGWRNKIHQHQNSLFPQRILRERNSIRRLLLPPLFNPRALSSAYTHDSQSIADSFFIGHSSRWGERQTIHFYENGFPVDFVSLRKGQLITEKRSGQAYETVAIRLFSCQPTPRDTRERPEIVSVAHWLETGEVIGVLNSG